VTRRSWDHGGKTRQRRGYGREHERIREQLKREVIVCEECRRKNPPQIRIGCIADHIIPLAKGGTGDRSNYQWLCRPCADAKDATDRGVKAKPVTGADGWPLSTDEWLKG
jgi:5-methylcytosine-specific restriction protein A